MTMKFGVMVPQGWREVQLSGKRKKNVSPE